MVRAYWFCVLSSFASSFKLMSNLRATRSGGGAPWADSMSACEIESAAMRTAAITTRRLHERQHQREDAEDQRGRPGERGSDTANPHRLADLLRLGPNRDREPEHEEGAPEPDEVHERVNLHLNRSDAAFGVEAGEH